MAKILIIDDDPDITESIRVVLESKGYSVISATGGEEGIEMQKSQNPDLIILDVMMPGIDGFDVARALKNEKPGVRILMLTAVKEKTGFDFTDVAGDEDWLPVDEYCEKPLNNKSLIAKVEKLLRSS